MRGAGPWPRMARRHVPAPLGAPRAERTQYPAHRNVQEPITTVEHFENDCYLNLTKSRWFMAICGSFVTMADPVPTSGAAILIDTRVRPTRRAPTGPRSRRRGSSREGRRCANTYAVPAARRCGQAGHDIRPGP